MVQSLTLINLSIEAKVLFTDVIQVAVFLFLPRKSKNGGAIRRNMLFMDPVWGSFFVLHENGMVSDQHETGTNSGRHEFVIFAVVYMRPGRNTSLITWDRYKLKNRRFL